MKWSSSSPLWVSVFSVLPTMHNKHIPEPKRAKRNESMCLPVCISLSPLIVLLINISSVSAFVEYMQFSSEVLIKPIVPPYFITLEVSTQLTLQHASELKRSYSFVGIEAEILIIVLRVHKKRGRVDNWTCPPWIPTYHPFQKVPRSWKWRLKLQKTTFVSSVTDSVKM